MPTEIQLHPGVPDYFVRAEGHPWSHRERYGDELVNAYEAGHVVVFDAPWLALDYAFLRSLPVIPMANASRALKKAKMANMLAPIVPETFQATHVLAEMGITPDQAHRFQDQIHLVNVQVRGFIAYTFPHYKVTAEEGNTWRFTQTEKEGLHYDSYGDATHDDHQVRLFVNVDDQPRLWRTGPQLDAALPFYRDRVPPEARARHPNLVNSSLNKVIPWESTPAHEIAFAPGATWLANSQLVSHEIVFGRRLLAYTSRVDPATMNDPSRNFAAWARRLWSE